MRTSVSGSALTISNSFFAGSVSEPLLATVGLAATPQPHLEIGGREPHLVALGVDQDIGENRNRVLALDDALKKLQFAQQISLPDDEFHASAVLEC